MTMNNMYTDSNLNILLRKKKTFVILLFLTIALFVVCFAIFIIFAKYENKLTMQITGSIVLSIFVCFIVYFISRIFYLNGVITQFSFIKNNNGETILAEVISVSDDFITLMDKTRVKEIKINVDNTTKIVYLIDTFDYDFVVNKKYSLTIVSDYIKEISYEDKI